MIHVSLPGNLQTLAGTGRMVELEVSGAPTQRSLLDALEVKYPALLGTIRDATTKKRRPLLRFYACEEDLSDVSPDDPLPAPVVTGTEPYIILGAIAGG
ncbi:MAG TPA: MoaD/ThiS family protein [Candidatus Sulfotelmatobacter sp.]|nr:MoaD/ThiS family protein [Candidatus Sulfotelmatobacter sp.]